MNRKWISVHVCNTSMANYAVECSEFCEQKVMSLGYNYQLVQNHVIQKISNPMIANVLSQVVVLSM